MSNPTEQPIDPDKMVTWCDLCNEEITGFDEWKIHLGSKGHLSRINEK